LRLSLITLRACLEARVILLIIHALQVVRVAVGLVKEAVRGSDTEALILARSARPGSQGRLRDLSYVRWFVTP